MKMRKKENLMIPENEETINLGNPPLQNQKEKLTGSTKIPVNREDLYPDQFFAQFDERVVTEILFPQSLSIVMKKIMFHKSGMVEPKVIIENDGKSVEPSLISFGSKKIAVSKILCAGKEEKVLLEILITESGKILMRRFDYSDTGDFSMEIIYPPDVKAEVKSTIFLSSSGIIETKKIYFPDDDW